MEFTDGVVYYRVRSVTDTGDTYNHGEYEDHSKATEIADQIARYPERVRVWVDRVRMLARIEEVDVLRWTSEVTSPGCM